MGQTVAGLAGAGIGFLVGGGPVGAQIGWALASTAWALTHQPKMVSPRLEDLIARGADYGWMRPIVFGTIRIGGMGMGQGSTSNGPNKFTEHGEDGGGKGDGGQTSYSYSLSFFNEICEGPIAGVRRRWGNGRLLTENGEAASEKWPFVLYLGTTDQMPDPTMETIYGAGRVCPMRGVAYEAVTEVSVEDFGRARPNVEYEVFTTAGEGNLRIVKSNYDTGSGVFSNMPIIVDWPESGDIVVAANSLSPDPITTLVTAKAFSTDDLSYIGPAVATGLTFPSFWDDGSRQGLGYHVLAGGSRTPLWISHVFGSYKVENAVVTPGDGITNFLENAGVDGSEYVCAMCFSQDGTQLFVFTNPSSGGTAAADTWHKIVDGEVVESGTVDPPIALDAWGNNTRPHGTGSPADAFGRTMSAENNGEYFWYLNNTTAAEGTVSIYRIDGDGNFAEWTGGTVQAGWATTGGDAGVEASLQTLATDGFCGAFRGNSLVLFSRLGDPDKVSLGSIVAALLDRAGFSSDEYDVTDLTQMVRGFAVASQMEVANAINLLRNAFLFDACSCDGKIVFRNRGHDADYTIPDSELGAHEPGTEKPELLECKHIPQEELVRTVWIKYYNFDNDYQPDAQYWTHPTTLSKSDVTIDIPVVMTAGEAQLLAQTHIHYAYLERDLFTFYVDDSWAKIRPTDVVVVRGVNIRVTTVTEMPTGIIRCEGVRAFAGAFTDGAAPTTPVDGDLPGGPGLGQPPQDPPRAKVATQLVLLDIPVLTLGAYPYGFYAAGGPARDGPWSGYTLYKSLDEGASWVKIATTSSKAIIGQTTGALDDYGGSLTDIDEASEVEVVLTDPRASLSSITADAFANGGGAIAIRSGSTWEILQYRDAVLTAPKTYTLTGFYRGRKGTDGAIGGHAAGDTFVVLPCLNVDAPKHELNVPLLYKAVTHGTAIDDAEVIEFTNTGEGEEEWSGGVDEILPSNGAGYVLTGSNAALPNARVITAGTNITLTDGGPGSTLTISASGGGGGGAPTNAQYLTLATDGTLTHERVATGSANISLTDAGAGSTCTFDLTDTGVSAGAYGSSVSVVGITVDAKGRVTAVSDIPIVGRIQTLENGSSVDPTAIALNFGAGLTATDAGSGVTLIEADASTITGGGALIYKGVDPPSSPEDYVAWINTETGSLNVYWDDGTSSQWFEPRRGPRGPVGATGATGSTGATGATGAAGQGVPTGGTTGQALVKIDGTNYNTQWATVSASPGGSNTQVQFNNAGAFGGSSSFTWSGTRLSPNYVTLSAGTTSAGTSPLKFTSGSLMSAAEAGAIEFLTDKFYATISTGTARKELALWDAAATSGRIPYATTNGRLVDSSNLVYDSGNVRLGIGGTPSKIFHAQASSSGEVAGVVQNTSTGAAAYTGWFVANSSLSNYVWLYKTSTGYTTSGLYTQGSGGLQNTSGHLVISNTAASSDIAFAVGGMATTDEAMRIDSARNVSVGNAAIATNAANGFLYIPTCAGTPTGTPTAKTGRAPIVWDSTNKKLYVYDGGWNAMN